MELYDPHPKTRLGGIMPWAGLVLLVAVAVTVVGATIRWLVCPSAAVLWRTWVAPIVESVRQAIGT